jgi:acetylornithine aminotransferase
VIEHIPERSSYPRALGLDSLRESAASWLSRRFEVDVCPSTEVLPTNGSKEALFTLPLSVLDRRTRPLALIPDPAYPVYALGVNATGGQIHSLPLLAENGFLPDLASVPGSVWERVSLLWINYPNNPTGAVASLEFYREAAARCREHGVVLASDEAYSEIYYGEPPPSALGAGTENVIVFHTLSKRSGMPGFRSGFMAGDARLIDALKRIRPAMGVATPQFIQEAGSAAWNDEEHVSAIRERCRHNRDLALGLLRKSGLRVPEVPATFYIWLPVPGEDSSEVFATRCLEAGVVVLPGTALGPGGEGYVRISLTEEPDRVQEALDRLGRLSV